MSGPRTVMECIRLATDHLRAGGRDTPRLDAEVLLGAVLNLDRIQLYVQHDRPLDREELDRYRTFVARRAKGEPVAYIVGSKEFLSLDLAVDPRVLVPRPETELLVETAADLLARIPDGEEIRAADIGTGSGAIAIGLAAKDPRPSILATDIDEGALEVAKANARRHGFSDRISFRKGDLLDALDDIGYHAILSNPPYIAEEAWDALPVDVRKFEPRRALVGGRDGLWHLRALIESAGSRLLPGGFLALEIGSDQGREVVLAGRRAGFAEVRLLPDLAGRDRVAVMVKETSPL